MNGLTLIEHLGTAISTDAIKAINFSVKTSKKGAIKRDARVSSPLWEESRVATVYANLKIDNEYLDMLGVETEGEDETVVSFPILSTEDIMGAIPVFSSDYFNNVISTLEVEVKELNDEADALENSRKKSDKDRYNELSDSIKKKTSSLSRLQKSPKFVTALIAAIDQNENEKTRLMAPLTSSFSAGEIMTSAEAQNSVNENMLSRINSSINEAQSAYDKRMTTIENSINGYLSVGEEENTSILDEFPFSYGGKNLSFADLVGMVLIKVK